MLNYPYSNIKLYLVNINSITLTKNGTNYLIEDEKEHDIRFHDLVKLDSWKKYSKYGYVLYQGEKFNLLSIFKIDNDTNYEFILPKEYLINEEEIIKLYDYAHNNS